MFDLSRLSIGFLAGTLGQGGAERQLFYLLSALKESGARLQLFCLTRGEFWEDALSSLEIPVIWIGQHPSRLARLVRLIGELRKDRPQIIQSQHFYTNIYAAAAARALGLREIGALRNDCVSEVQSVGKFMGKISLRLPRTIAANSQAAIRKATEMGFPGTRLHWLSNVVDTSHFTPRPRGLNETIKIAAVGRLVNQKRFDRFLSVLARANAQAPGSFQALIAGEGPLRPRLERQAAEAGLQEIVQFAGAVSDPREIYHKVDLLVLTSDWEGSPNVVLEAMACGLPVVATRVGDLSEFMVEGETGFLAAPEDEEKLVAAVTELRQNAGLRREMGRRARESVVAQHSLQQLPRRLQPFYEAVLA
ncbi:MAG TPA: glycosyltransferase [Blastocatellia bacterium]|nr:glycosyltransferase [Blastocatellia bacterium]